MSASLLEEPPRFAAYVTGVPVDMRADVLQKAFASSCGAVARVEMLPIRFPRKGSRSAIVVFTAEGGLRVALSRSPLLVDGAKLPCRRFGEAGRAAVAIGRAERRHERAPSCPRLLPSE